MVLQIIESHILRMQLMKGSDIPEIVDRFADAVENGLRELPQFDLDSISDYEQIGNMQLECLLKKDISKQTNHG